MAWNWLEGPGNNLSICLHKLVTATFAVEHLLRGFEWTVTQVTNTGVGRLLCVCLFRHDSTFDVAS